METGGWPVDAKAEVSHHVCFTLSFRWDLHFPTSCNPTRTAPITVIFSNETIKGQLHHVVFDLEVLNFHFSEVLNR